MGHNHEQGSQAMQSIVPDGYRIWLVCNYTDLRKSIDGLFDIADLQYGVSPMEKNAFLFCGRRCDRVKVFYYMKESYHLHYIRASEVRYQWPRKEKELWELNREQMERLLSGDRISREHAATIIPSRI